MESTGVYWKPKDNLLETTDIEVLVVNAQRKGHPRPHDRRGRAEWIADLARHGLLSGSFIPDRHQREPVRCRRSAPHLLGRGLSGQQPKRRQAKVR